MKERLKVLRKALGLSGEKIVEPLGMKRSAVSNIENGRSNLAKQSIIAICSICNVNEKWLRTGEGEIFDETTTSVPDDLTKQFNLRDIDIRIVESFLNLSPENRAVIKDDIISI